MALGILISLIPTLLFEDDRDIQLVLGVAIKAGLLVYYLNLNNRGTPFIQTLTFILLIMLFGEYLFNTGRILVGQVIFIIANIVFAVMYFLRQVMKTQKGKVNSLKISAVVIYCVGNIIYILDTIGLPPLVIGTLFLSGVYFYDRLMLLSEIKGKSQQRT